MFNVHDVWLFGLNISIWETSSFLFFNWFENAPPPLPLEWVTENNKKGNNVVEKKFPHFSKLRKCIFSIDVIP